LMASLSLSTEEVIAFFMTSNKSWWTGGVSFRTPLTNVENRRNTWVAGQYMSCSVLQYKPAGPAGCHTTHRDSSLICWTSPLNFAGKPITYYPERRTR
jgi:hypothetical protein